MKTAKVRRTPESMPCKITDKERLEFADALAEASHAVDNAEAAKATALKQFTYEINLAKTRRDKLANIVASRTEYRDVVVEERWDYGTDKYTRTRTDTGEVVFERRLSDDERQLEMIEDDSDGDEDA